jgi:hypothetical protein
VADAARGGTGAEASTWLALHTRIAAMPETACRACGMPAAPAPGDGAAPVQAQKPPTPTCRRSLPALAFVGRCCSASSW